VRRGLTWLAAASLAVAGFGALAGETHANGPSPKIDGSVLRATTGGASASFGVYLRDQADLTAAYAMKDQDARGWYVYRTLRDEAARTQAPIRELLDARGADYTSYWAANMIVAHGDRALVDELAARADVHAIEPDEKASGLEEVPLLPTPLERLEANGPAAAATVEWGVNDVHAPAVWSLGFTGQGMVVASADTGVRWQHAALKSHYRGWNGTTADNDYNWHDAIHSGGGICGPNTIAPCDDDSHGSHTTGTAIGDDGAGNQIGVAPGAKWIGCRNMDRGTGSPATYTECFQWFMAPTTISGQNADPTKRPHVITNSWTCPASEGCAANTLQTIVTNTEASGIFVEASAGNSGPSCSTVSDPPAIYASAFSTGAVDISNTLAGFSSRGPVTSDGSGRMKPDVVSPGVNVRSSTNSTDTSYASFSGTSMAGPHVAGVVALLWSARPDLVRNIAATKQVLTSTANPSVAGGGSGCGGSAVVPNNHFGWGLVDARAAVGAGSTTHVLSVSKSGGGTGTVTSSPAGISCGTSCSAVYDNGTTVTLTAAADAGAAFTGWSGDCSGTGTCTVTMSADHSVTATFAAQPHTLSVAVGGAGGGTVTSSPAGISCPGTCSASFAGGSTVTLTATPTSGSSFSSWSGDCSGTGTCTVTMTADHAVSASFAASAPRLTVTKSGSGSGTVTSTPAGIDCGTTCSATFATGTVVTLKAKAAGGSSFGGWSGDCSGTSTCKVTMSADHAVTATFTRRRATSACVVPRVRGVSVTNARRAIARAHCAVGTVTRAYSTRVKTGRVIRQRPVPGVHRRAGAKVTLLVSRGKSSR
jgi:subtilisin family serine protease